MRDNGSSDSAIVVHRLSAGATLFRQDAGATLFDDATPSGRALGQVATPRAVADWMTRWACADEPRRILEPSLGEGVFVRAMEAFYRSRPTRQRPTVDAWELDAAVLRRFERTNPELAVACHRADFLTAGHRSCYDAAVANPPYVRHHELNYCEEVFRGFDRHCGRRISRMTNLYGLFMVKIWSLLAPGGRAAVITPAEWLNADFGTALKAYLLEQNAIEGIVHFAHASTIFPDALTTAMILLLRRGRSAGEPIRLASVEDVGSLSPHILRDARTIAPSALAPARKWSAIIEDGVSQRGGTRSGAAELSVGGRRLGEVATCSRGIATGANGYFALRPSQCRNLGIAPCDVRACITRARQINGGLLDDKQIARLLAADEPVYLLSPRRTLTKAVERYLDAGRRQGIDRRYLPSHRPVWYRPEHREPAPILISVFARGDFRVVLNKAGVLNLTAYHGIYPRRATAARVRALYEYLTGPEGRQALARHRRIYGGGLSKLEPRDVEAVEMPEDVYAKVR